VARLPDDESPLSDTPVIDQDNPTSFTLPLEDVHEGVRAVSSYSERVQRAQSKTSSLKGKGKPLGGAPSIPKGKMSALTMPRPDFGDVEEAKVLDPPEPVDKTSPIGGVGSAYKVNQRLAAGQTDGPVSMADAKKKPQDKLSKGTAKALKMMDNAVKEHDNPEEEAPVQPDLDTEDVKKDLNRADKDLERPRFDVDGLVRARNALLSEERREAIEERLKPLDIADLVTKKEIQQRVPVVPGKMEFTLRTLTQYENIFCLQYVYEFPGSEAYANEVLNTAKLVCSIVAINDALLHSHLDGRSVDRDAFQKKWDQLVEFPVQMVGDMSVQLIWFNNRVNQLYDIGNLKNG